MDCPSCDAQLQANLYGVYGTLITNGEMRAYIDVLDDRPSALVRSSSTSVTCRVSCAVLDSLTEPEQYPLNQCEIVIVEEYNPIETVYKG